MGEGAEGRWDAQERPLDSYRIRCIVLPSSRYCNSAQMSGYTKLFTRILDSTIWREDDPTRLLWITMLALADRDGNVFCTIPGLADRARITLKQCEYALERFQQPDKYSWSQENQGRRIAVIEGGWYLINHSKFRALMSEEDQREKTRRRVAKWREKNKSVTVTKCNAGNDKQKHIQNTEVESSKDLCSRDHGKSILEGGFCENQTTPENLHPVNYAIKILEQIQFPHTPDNLRVVAAAIEAEVKSGKSKASAYEFVLAGVLDAKQEGVEINRFFFADAKYRTENRKNGNGRETVGEKNRRAFDEYKRLGRAT